MSENKDSKTVGKHKENVGGRGRKRKRKPVLSGTNLHYEVGGKSGGIGVGGIRAFHLLVTRLGLQECLNRELGLLKRYLPYRGSDHVLNIVYNVLGSGSCLGDIERLRNDPNYLNALGAERIPDPTTEEISWKCRSFTPPHHPPQFPTALHSPSISLPCCCGSLMPHMTCPRVDNQG